MKDTARKLSALILALLLSTALVSAKDKDKGKHSNNKEFKKTSVRVDVDIFQGEDRDLIRNHYRAYGDSLPPGLAKRGGDLPPGLQKQLIRKGHLPPGLEKKLYPFPIELERRLPPLRSGLSRWFIGGSAVILDNRTKVILDVFAVR